MTNERLEALARELARQDEAWDAARGELARNAEGAFAVSSADLDALDAACEPRRSLALPLAAAIRA